MPFCPVPCDTLVTLMITSFLSCNSCGRTKVLRGQDQAVFLWARLLFNVILSWVKLFSVLLCARFTFGRAVPGWVFRVCDIVSVLHVKIDSHAPENTYDVRSDFFAFVAEEEPPCTVPGSAALNFFTTVQCRSSLCIHTSIFASVPWGIFVPWSTSWTRHARGDYLYWSRDALVAL